jgi:hypothetical protein
MFALMHATAWLCSVSQKPTRMAATPLGAHSQFWRGWVSRHLYIARIDSVQGVADPMAKQFGKHFDVFSQVSLRDRSQIVLHERSREGEISARTGEGLARPPPGSSCDESIPVLSAGSDSRRPLVSATTRAPLAAANPAAAAAAARHRRALGMATKLVADPWAVNVRDELVGCRKALLAVRSASGGRT